MGKNLLKTEANILSEENILNWAIIQKDFEKSFGTEVYSSWLKNILLLKEYNHYVILGVPTRFFRDWITSRYADKILSELKRHKLSIDRIEFKIIEKEKLENKIILPASGRNKIMEMKDSILSYNRLNNNLSFDNFVVGQSNKISYLSAKKICTQ